MTPTAATGALLILIGLAFAVPEIFTPRPVPGVIGCGLLAAIFGGLLLADSLEPKGRQ